MNEPNTTDTTHYVGFWVRVAACTIDSALVMAIILPAILFTVGVEFIVDAGLAGYLYLFFEQVVPAALVILFWMWKSSTPGKMLFNAKIVDAETGDRPSIGQFIGRYIAYYPAMLPFFVGIIWVGFDARKQGWHDKLARTVVVRRKI